MLERCAVWLGRNVRLRGTQRLIRLLFPIGANGGRHVEGERIRGDSLKCHLDSRQVIDWGVLFTGDYEPHISALFMKLLGPGCVAVDVGANVGMHTLTLARIVGSSGRVMAFEPNPNVRRRLERNVELNGFWHVRIDGHALGAQLECRTLRVPAAGTPEAANPGMASLVALDTPHDLVDVSVAPLDDLFAETGLERLDMVKIDVQGFEVHVLRGMASIAERFRPAVVFEYEAWAWKAAGYGLQDALGVLQRWGYRVWQIEHRGGALFQLAQLSPDPEPHVELLALAGEDPRVRIIAELTSESGHG